MSGIRFKNSVLVVILILAVFFAGCNAPQDQLAAFNGHFERFDFENSAHFAAGKISKHKNPKGED